MSLIYNHVKSRNSAVELLRLILMFLIVVGHCIMHGMGLINLNPASHFPLTIPSDQMPFVSVAYGFCVCAVNCFVLISGYFGIKTSLKKILYLVFALFFYSLIFNIIPQIIEHDFKGAIASLLILSHNPYWFVLIYLFLMVFAPLLNLAYEKMPQRSTDLFLIALIIISCYFGYLWNNNTNYDGYNLIQFIMMYCIGRKIRYSNFSLPKSTSLIGFIICSVVCGISIYYAWLFGHPSRAWKCALYNNPIVIGSAIFLMLLFKNFQINSRTINLISRSAFGIYLFQESLPVQKLLYGYVADMSLHESGFRLTVIILTASLIVCLIAIPLDAVRIYIYDKLLKFSTVHLPVRKKRSK